MEEEQGKKNIRKKWKKNRKRKEEETRMGGGEWKNRRRNKKELKKNKRMEEKQNGRIEEKEWKMKNRIKEWSPLDAEAHADDGRKLFKCQTRNLTLKWYTIQKKSKGNVMMQASNNGFLHRHKKNNVKIVMSNICFYFTFVFFCFFCFV